MDTLSLRLFTPQDGPFIAEWVADTAYQAFFRHCSHLPNYEECLHYPTWSQNIVMMVIHKDHQSPVGMVVGYGWDYRNQNVKAGILIDKQFHKNGVGSAAMTLWVSYLSRQMGFRKISVEIVDEYLVKVCAGLGFIEEGRFKNECFMNNKWVDEIRMSVTN